MEIRYKKCKSGNIWTFVNESWNNSNGWGHKTTVFRWDYDYDPYKVRYYNRTWESYTYQWCMRGAIGTIYENGLNRFLNNYKEKNNITRFKKGQKEQLVEDFNNTPLGQDLQELKDAIEYREFSSITVK